MTQIANPEQGFSKFDVDPVQVWTEAFNMAKNTLTESARQIGSLILGDEKL